MKHLDLFSGIGGFALAVRWLGHETVGFCEIDEWSRRVLDKHWPGVPKHDDIKTLRGDQFGAVDLVTGGYPCQPFSLAGKREGANDDRHLWPQMRRVIDEARPRFVLAENVAGHISMGLDTVLAEMEADGYTCGAIVIPAAGVNALHKRERIWIMAHSGDDRSQAELQPISHRPEYATVGNRGAFTGGEGVVYSEINAGSQARAEGGETWSRSASGYRGQYAGAGAVQVARTVDAGTDGLPPELVRRSWADGTWELDLPRVVTHEPERKQKLQAAGNAIVPQVAYEILRVMIGEAT